MSGPWRSALARLRGDRVALACGGVVAAFLLVVLAAAAGWGADWQEPAGAPFAPPAWLAAAPAAGPAGAAPAAPASAAAIDDLDPLAGKMGEIERQAQAASAPVAAATPRPLWMGGDRWGRDVVAKTVQGAKVSIAIGLSAALLAVALGGVLGALAGYFGGWIDGLCEALYTLLEAMPGILLILALAAVFSRGTATVVAIFALTGWTGTYRLLRGEVLKQRVRPYVSAAEAIGVGHAGRILRHIAPNVSHLLLVQLSLLTIAFIKGEAILSFLGFGVPVDAVSWGTMIAESQTELVNGRWWQLAAAGTSMAVFVTAFSFFADGLRDALDPRLNNAQ